MKIQFSKFQTLIKVINGENVTAVEKAETNKYISRMLYLMNY